MTEVEHSLTPPPNWDILAKSFSIKEWVGNIVVTYGGMIYSPMCQIPPQTIAHEMVHVKQQLTMLMSMEEMLEKYCNDINFLREVEAPAFKAEAEWLEQNITNEAELWCRKHRLAKSMATMYKGAFTYETASAIIKHK